MSVVLDGGLTQRSLEYAARPGIPNTLGWQGALKFRLALGRVLYVSAGPQITNGSQSSKKDDPSIGDWSGNETFPIVPAVGLRIGRIDLELAYPYGGAYSLQSKTANGVAVSYHQAKFIQVGLQIEGGRWLYGGQFRTGTYALENAGGAENILNPNLKVKTFTLLLSYRIF